MKTDEERKERLEKMVATTQLRLALETEEERSAKKDCILLWIEIGVKKKNSRNELACHVMGHFSSSIPYSLNWMVTNSSIQYFNYFNMVWK